TEIKKQNADMKRLQALQSGGIKDEMPLIKDRATADIPPDPLDKPVLDKPLLAER
ncbi:hypothetical protein HZB90_01310, partial [archaeon]|nr:hypothetical protein [archaeon]